MRAPALIVAGAALMLAGQADAQSIASRVATVRDGKVRMTFASRDEICGFPNGISTRSNTRNHGNWSPKQTEDVDYGSDCSEGPARIAFDVAGGRVTRIRAYVGGRWRPADRVTDLGAVSVKEATDWLMGIAASHSGKVAGNAIFATTLADSVQMSGPLYRFARDESRPTEAREQAIFWMGQMEGTTAQLRGLYSELDSDNMKDKVIFALSQQRGVNDEWLLDLVANRRESIEMRKKALFWAGQTGASVAELSSLYGRMTEREMKDQMIFVFSQKREPAAVDKLMQIAQTDPDRETRRKALFWLGQSKDPRVMTMLSDIINR